MTDEEAHDLHRLAMAIADAADMAAKLGEHEGQLSRTLYREAMRVEANVAAHVTLEPSRSILWKSAAWLAVKGALSGNAMLYAQHGLRMENGGRAVKPPYPQILDELREVYEVARKMEVKP